MERLGLVSRMPAARREVADQVAGNQAILAAKDCRRVAVGCFAAASELVFRD
jgi:hypothetical protein